MTARTYNGSTATLSYDLLDQLVQWNAGASSQEWYAYDLAGNRTLRRSTTGSGTSITVSAFGLQEHVYSASGTPQSSTYYYPLGGRLIGELQGSTTQFFLSDALGSILTTFSATAGRAAVQGNQVYGPYGSSRYSQGMMGTSKGFTGQYADATGLDYDNARYYDPVVGRFLSADPVQGNTSGMDPYGYVGGNPETLTDPSGLMYGQVAGGGGGPSCDQSCQALKQVPGGGSCCDLACQLHACDQNVGCHTKAVGQGPSVDVNVASVQGVDGTSGVAGCIGLGVCIQFSTLERHYRITNYTSRMDTTFDVDLCISGVVPHGCDGGGEAANDGTPEGGKVEGDLPPLAGSLQRVEEACGGGLSFTPTTTVSTEQGPQEIGQLHPGDKVWAYNQQTGKMELEPILHVWLNHDNDLVDLTITPSVRVPEAPVSKGKGQPSETLHTNKKHPFLTVEQGFLPVGEIKVGMHVQRADGTYNGSTATLSYDLLDQLVQWNAGASSQEWYAYDLTGNRTLRRSTTGSGTSITVYAFGLEEHVYSASGTPQSSTYYYPLGGRLIAEVQGSATQFFLSDALGSILTTFTATAGSASVQGNQVYGPYGTSRYSQGSMGTNKGFTGQYADATGLDYYNARYYDPVIGRFLSADPVQGNTSDMDPYAYVGGNPETLTDPSGLRYGQVAGGGGGPSCDQYCQALKQVPGGGSSCDLACQLNKDGVSACKIGSTCVVNTAVKGPSSVMPVRTGGTSSSLLACGGVCILINTVTPPQTINLHVETAFQAQMCVTVWGGHACDGGGGDDTEGEEGPSKPDILASDDTGGTGKPKFPNQFPERLRAEIELAEELGVKPVKVGDPEFQALIQDGDVKWAVTEDEELLFIPKYVDGIEINHTVLTNGDPVMAAGEAKIINTGNGYSAIEFNRWSGHFRPDEASEIIGRAAFTKAGINFPPPILGLRW